MTTVDIDIVKNSCAQMLCYHRDNSKLICDIVRHTLIRVDSMVTKSDDIKSYFIGEDGIMAVDIFRMKKSNKIKRLRRYRE